MLTLLEARNTHHATRLQTHQTNALTFTPTHPYDLVVTHFFLDCLTQPELEALIQRLTPALEPNALWLISDFRIPTGPMRLPARAMVRSLYLAFRILTGLRTTRLPDHATPLTAAGFTQIAGHTQPRRSPHHPALATHRARIHSNQRVHARPNTQTARHPLLTPRRRPHPTLRATGPLPRRARPRRLPPRTRRATRLISQFAPKPFTVELIETL